MICRINLMDRNTVTRCKMMKLKENMKKMNKIMMDSNNNTWMTKKYKMKLKVKTNIMKMIKISKSIRNKMGNNMMTNNNKKGITNKSINKMVTNNKATSIKTTKWTNSSNNNLVAMDNSSLINSSSKCGILLVTN